jgi:hypothetical protein
VFGVTVSRRQITLGYTEVAEEAPFCGEGGLVAVLLGQLHTVVAATQSRVDFNLPAGTVLTISAADLVWWDSCLPTLLSHDRSTVLLALPFFLGWITIITHHESASPTSTLSNPPFLTSASRPALTSSLKWRGTLVGLLQYVRGASGGVWIFIGCPAVIGQCCLLQVLKAPALKWFLMNSSSTFMLLAVAGIGNWSGGSTKNVR